MYSVCIYIYIYIAIIVTPTYSKRHPFHSRTSLRNGAAMSQQYVHYTLYYTLYYAKLYYTILYYTVQYSTIILYDTVLYYNILLIVYSNMLPSGTRPP